MPRTTPLVPAAVLAVCLFAAPARAGEGFHIEGTVHDDFPAIAGRVAILPPIAPLELDVTWLDRQLAGQTDSRPKAPLVALREVRAAIARLGIDSAEPIARAPLAAELGVDSFLEMRISNLATWLSAEAEPDPDEGTVLKRKKTDRARARVEVRIVSAKSATTWFEGTTYGTTIARSVQPLLADMFDKLYERAYPERKSR
jgi:hypothetical protein